MYSEFRIGILVIDSSIDVKNKMNWLCKNLNNLNDSNPRFICNDKGRHWEKRPMTHLLLLQDHLPVCHLHVVEEKHMNVRFLLLDVVFYSPCCFASHYFLCVWIICKFWKMLAICKTLTTRTMFFYSHSTIFGVHKLQPRRHNTELFKPSLNIP